MYSDGEGNWHLAETHFDHHSSALRISTIESSETELRINWEIANGMTALTLEIENDDLGFELRKQIAPEDGYLDLPLSLFDEGETYEVSLIGRSIGGNDSAIEVEVKIEPGKSKGLRIKR